MVLVSEKLNPKACFEFEADIYLLYHVNSITKGFQATIHVGNVCQTAQITFMSTVIKQYFKLMSTSYFLKCH